jgi:hypothetical protein
LKRKSDPIFLTTHGPGIQPDPDLERHVFAAVLVRLAFEFLIELVGARELFSNASSQALLSCCGSSSGAFQNATSESDDVD